MANRKPHGSDIDPSKKKNRHKLTDREEAFCQLYLIDLNRTKAAKLAGYSETAASNTGSKLMQKEKIRERIAEIRHNTARDFDLTRENLLQELARIVYADPRKLYDEDGRQLSFTELDDDLAASIAGVEFDILGRISKLKRWDKTRAIETIAKILGYNTPEVVVNKNINLNSEPMNKEDAQHIAKLLEINL